MLPASCVLRLATAADDVFLEQLHASSRDDLRLSGLDDAVLLPLLRMQHRVQLAGMRQQYPDAVHWIVVLDGAPAGRLVVDADGDTLRVIDIAVLPAMRRRGVARAALQGLQQAAHRQGKSITLGVTRNNVAARALYLGLGFRVTSADELFEQMAWEGTGG